MICYGKQCNYFNREHFYNYFNSEGFNKFNSKHFNYEITRTKVHLLQDCSDICDK